MDIDYDKFFSQLDAQLDQMWGDLIKTSPLLASIEEGRMTRALYAMYMLETYHYTAHNARNQAMVGLRPECGAPYMKFCLEHAADEVGHEKMALHDVLSMGLKDADIVVPPPLLETEVLISYLYWVSVTGNPLQRLGYSYWAESCYGYINPLIEKIQKQLQLKPSQMTFFVAHSDIDEDHFLEVRNTIKRTCKTPADLEAVRKVMVHSLQLTGKMLDGVYAAYERHLSAPSEAHAFLRDLRA